MELLHYVTFLVFSLVAMICNLSECGPLNDYILDYQPLVYDRNTVHTNHLRVRRSADPHVYIRFSAFGRNFKLQLSPSQGIFMPSHQLYTDDKGLRPVDTSFIYEGVVVGVPGSSVHMSLHNGSIEGEVNMPDTTYHIEPAVKYIPNSEFHTIIYPETHLNTDPYRVRREAEKHTCGVDHADIHEFMERASRLEEPSTSYRSRRDLEDLPHNIYAEYSNRDKHSSRHTRATPALGTQNTCPLHMRADYILFDYFKTKKYGRTITDDQAEEEILAFFASHVNAITTIYRSTIFQTYNRDLKNSGLGFSIHRTTVMKDPSKVDSGYSSPTLDVSNYLDLTSKENHDLYCLTFTFTYRDFSGGTLGLAWVATEANTQSGVCGKYSTFSGGVKKSLNTGIVTIINYGKTVPNKVSQLTFAHEVGHNFGSPHDEGSPACAPFGTNLPDATNGNFIMFPSATSGDRLNNDKFSICSRDNMTRIIQQVVERIRAPAGDCFIGSNQSFCGNKITEPGEQCDCGFAPCDPNKTCCVGREENNTGGCVRASGKVCSPQSGPCCRDDCTYYGSSQSCQEATECLDKSYCNGTTFTCPAAVHKAEGTLCSGYTKVCKNGECIASLCSKIGWDQCFSDIEDKLCYIACRNGNGTCVSSKDDVALARPENEPFRGLLQNATRLKLNSTQALADNLLAIAVPAGSPCDNYRGYCDSFSKCQRIDADGPFNQLTNMIFSPVTLKKIEDWIVEHWWAVLLMGVGLVVFMGIFVKVFGYNTPSQDPKRRPAQGQGRRQHQKSGNNARPVGRSSNPPKQASPSAPPPYTTDMDMHHYQDYHHPGSAQDLHDYHHVGNRVQPASQYDRIAPPGSKYHI